MKTSYKLASVALLGALGVGLAVASETKETNASAGKGKIEFTQGSFTGLGPSDTMLPPDTSEPYIKPTDGIITGNGLRQLEFISPLDFEKHNVLENAKEETYDVLAYTAPRADGNGNFTMPHFVRFRDMRVDEGVENFYSLTAEMTQDFTNGSSTLDGTLQYTDLRLTSSNNGPSLPDANDPDVSFAKTGITLTKDNGVQNVLNHRQAGQGYGRHEIMFGDYVDSEGNALAEGDTYKSIQLTVPAKTIVKSGTYNAVITWTIADAK